MTVEIAAPDGDDLARIRRWIPRALDRDPDATAVLDLLWAAAAPDRRLVARLDGRPVGVALGSLRATTGAGHTDLIAVDPAARRLGAGRALLAALEDRLRAAGATAFMLSGNPPVFGWPGIDVAYTPALCLAETSGYTKVADAFNMTVNLTTTRLDTTADEGRLAAAGLTVSRLSPRDATEFEAWARVWGGTWAAEGVAALAFDPPRIHVARRGPRIVGFAAYGINQPAWFGPMATDSGERGTGIGGVLLRRCLADLRVAGRRSADIGWVGPMRFYARAVGARVGRIYWAYRKEI